jgi:hypothetical protein
MQVFAFEGVVENGCIHFPAGVLLPENTKVYVIVPGASGNEDRRTFHIPSVRFAHSGAAKDFEMEVRDIEEEK